MERFPVPVDDQPIPRGWFRRFVSFVNSLIVRGDNSTILVKHDKLGTLVQLNPSFVNSLKQAASPPASGGTASGLAATVSGGTASVSVSGSIPLSIIPGSNITITGATNGIVIEATGGTASVFPVWDDFHVDNLNHLINWDNGIMDPVVVPLSGYLKLVYGSMLIADQGNSFTATDDLFVSIDSIQIVDYERRISFSPGYNMPDISFSEKDIHSQIIPVSAGSTVTATSTSSAPSLGLYLITTQS